MDNSYEFCIFIFVFNGVYYIEYFFKGLWILYFDNVIEFMVEFKKIVDEEKVNWFKVCGVYFIFGSDIIEYV